MQHGTALSFVYTGEADRLAEDFFNTGIKYNSKDLPSDVYTRQHEISQNLTKNLEKQGII